MRFSKILMLPMLFLLALLQNVWATDSDADDGDIDDVPTARGKRGGLAAVAVDDETDGEVTTLTLDSLSASTANLSDNHGNLFFVDLMGESAQDAFQKMAALLGQLNSSIVDLDGASGRGAKELRRSIQQQLCGIQEAGNENLYLQYLFQGWGGFFSAVEESTSSPSKSKKSRGKDLGFEISALRESIGEVYGQIMPRILTKEPLAARVTAKIPSPKKDKVRSRRKALADLGNVGGSPRKERKGKDSTATAVAAPPPVSETTTA